MIGKSIKELVGSRHKVLTYQKKEGTRASYYCSDDELVLPERISFILNTRQGTRNAPYQIKGRYKQNDKGLYYHMNCRDVHTKIMPIPGNLRYVGWGEIDRRFKRYDLLVFEFVDEHKTILRIHHFRGLADPQYVDAVLGFLTTFKGRKRDV